MDTTVNIHYAKTHLSKLLRMVCEGTEVVIAKSGQPIARLVPIAKIEPRRPGGFNFKIGDEFFEPLPKSEQEAWDG